MTTFDFQLFHVNASGTRSRVDAGLSGPVGGVAGLGRFVRQDVADRAPQPTAVGNRLVRVLKGPRSHWPATGRTRNRGPWATGRSVDSFFVRQGRTTTGQYQPVELQNDARNTRGLAYAGFVDQGINAGPARRRANVRAVLRTWQDTAEQILDEEARP